MGGSGTGRLTRTVGRVGAQILRERVGPRVRPRRADEVPPSAEAITPEWLTDVLCADVPGGRVLDVRVEGGENGTSARRRLRVVHNHAGQIAGLPTSLFTKSTATFTARLLMGVTGIVEGETIFYNAVRPGLELRSPRAYYAGFDPATYRSMLLLEDLVEHGWTFPDPLDNRVSREDAQAMLAQMAHYHATFWDSPRLRSDLSRLAHVVPWQQSLNRIAFRKRTLVGLERAQDVVPGELTARREELHHKLMRSLELHRHAPETLLHQDVHLGNWLRDAEGRMGLYDWQCVARGQWALDVSYALAVALPIDRRRAWEKELLEFYLACLATEGVDRPPDLDEAWLAYRRQIMHSLTLALFSIGGSRLETDLQPIGYMLWAIERLAQFAVDLGTLDALADAGPAAA